MLGIKRHREKVFYYYGARRVEALNIGDKCPTCQGSSFGAGKNNRMVHYMDGLVWCKSCGTVRQTVESVLKYR